MPLLLPEEHLMSALCRGLKLGIANDWRELVPEAEIERSDLCPGHVLRPLYAAATSQYHGIPFDNIILKHTLWRYFRSFLPTYDGCVPPKHHWDRHYNHRQVLHPIKQVRYRQAKQWRWCAACARDECQEYGITFWHVEHQVPGLFYCHKHTEQRLYGTCSHCGYQINDLSKVPISFLLESSCHICKQEFVPQQALPEHPLLNWIAKVSHQLLSGATFNIELARLLIFDKLEIDPYVKKTVAGAKAVTRARRNIDGSLPLEVINCLFQAMDNQDFKPSDRVIPLDIGLLYKRDSFVHPLSWLVLAWVTLSDEEVLHKLIDNS
tara:strand:- start:246 stop:1211 length:966 start_codon:yes stop_codon:yes gene_type:complete